MHFSVTAWQEDCIAGFLLKPLRLILKAQNPTVKVNVI